MARRKFSDRTYTEVLTAKGWVQRSARQGERFVSVRRREYPNADGGTDVTFDVVGTLALCACYATRGLPTATVVAVFPCGVRLTWQY
jgi:hypothetical protein